MAFGRLFLMFHRCETVLIRVTVKSRFPNRGPKLDPRLQAFKHRYGTLDGATEHLLVILIYDIRITALNLPYEIHFIHYHLDTIYDYSTAPIRFPRPDTNTEGTRLINQVTGTALLIVNTHHMVELHTRVILGTPSAMTPCLPSFYKQ